MSAGPSAFTFLAGLPRARQALAYAQERHRGQRRASDDAPFIIHPLEVAALLYNTGHPEAVLVAAILHDTLEDTDAYAQELNERFGSHVAALVAAVTEDPRIEPYEARKAALRAQVARFDGDAIALYAADKVAKVRELRAQTAHNPATVHGDAGVRARLDHYVQSLAMLEDADRNHPLVRQFRFELEALHTLPPTGVKPADIPLPRGSVG